MLTRRIGRPGDVKLAVAGKRGVVDSAPGISQLAGAGLLRDDARLRFRGKLGGGKRILIRVLDAKRKRVVIAQFRVVPPSGAVAAGRRTLRLRLNVGTGSRARPDVSLGGKRPEAVRTEPLRP